MARKGTTQDKYRKRRAKEANASRLRRLLRRFGIGAAIVLVLLWFGAWISLSGVVQKAVGHMGMAIADAGAARGFAVQRILVEGRENTDADILRALINVEQGDPILSFSPREARELIRRLAWVKDAQVERRLPDTVYIGLTERRPLALWQHKGKVRLIDDEGVTLADSGFAKFRNLIILVGEDAPREALALIRMLEAEPLLRARTEAATWVGERRWDLKLKNGVVVRLPEGDLGLALRRLAAAQEEDQLLDKDVSVIDAREPDRMSVRTKPGAVQLYKAGFGDNI